MFSPIAPGVTVIAGQGFFLDFGRTPSLQSRKSKSKERERELEVSQSFCQNFQGKPLPAGEDRGFLIAVNAETVLALGKASGTPSPQETAVQHGDSCWGRRGMGFFEIW